jgi:hypothetical protein
MLLLQIFNKQKAGAARVANLQVSREILSTNLKRRKSTAGLQHIQICQMADAGEKR